MSLSNVASSAALIQQISATSPQQKTQLPNPFDLDDPKILHKVYLTHLKDEEKCDTDILEKLVSNVLSVSGSTQISGTATRSQITTSTSFKPEFRALKLISCQMITTRGAAHCAHQTTLWILQHLKCYSWDAKALIVLAAFSLEYGEFWRLYWIPTSDQLGNSLKQLNQVQSRKVPADITDLVTFFLEVYQHIRQWARWSAEDYDTEEVHSLSYASQVIPLVVYWTVAAAVASTGNLVGISDYKLSDFKKRLSSTVNKLKEHLTNCKYQTDRIEDHRRRTKDSEKIKDVVDLLKLLIHGNESDQKPQLYEGSKPITKGIEVFKDKHVLLFISSLDSIGDEILLLNSVYKSLQENPTEVIRGFKKEDFKILWIPVVEGDWNDNLKKRFKDFRKDIKWYVLEYFSELPGIGIIKKKLNYERDPIVSVINPQGEIQNENAKVIIFEWGIEAFPFRKQDAEDIIKKWKWLWTLIEKTDRNIHIEDIMAIKKDSYIFIYGGNDNKWIQDFTTAIGKIKEHEQINDVDLTVKHYELGKNDPDRVPYFWIGIDGKKLKKKCEEGVDCEIQEAVKSLLCLKQDPLGWVFLSKGRHIRLLGHGEPMLQTVLDFNKWKENVLEKDFDMAFKEYYNIKVKEISARCDNYTSDVLATITCPNPTCKRVMEVTSVNYRCCHHDDPNCCSV